MNKFIFLTITLLIFTLVALPLLSTFTIGVIPGGTQPPLGNTIKIYDALTYSESFISPANNLTGIGVSIKNPNFANRKKLIVNLYDDENKIIREVFLNGQNIADGKFVKILFEKVQDSKNKKFAWSVISPESSFSDALEIFLTDKKPYWSLELRLKGEVIPGGLSYVTLHKPASRFTVLTMVSNSFFSKVKDDKFFFIIYGLLIVALFILLSRFQLKNLKRPL